VPPKKHSTIWKAEPHTIAKIAILEGYLHAWFPIFGRGKGRFDLLYVDGFAGPGEYTNHSAGSPIAALRSATKALDASGAAWTAGTIHCAFIEHHKDRFNHLTERIAPFEGKSRLQIHLHQKWFVDGIAELKQQMPQAFSGAWPLFVFVDPFGATGVPFETVASILGSPRSEVLINFDADAIARIFQAGSSASHERLLNEIFGDDSWKTTLSESSQFSTLYRTILELYKARLRSLPNVRYVFSFEMSKSGRVLDYALIFASQHPTGLEKMKEAMQRMDQTGDYQFSDAHVGKRTLFRFDHPEIWSPSLRQRFAGQVVTYAEVRDFALNETPFSTPKSMLRLLEKQELLTVVSTNPKRKRGQFPERTTSWIEFKSEAPDG